METIKGFHMEPWCGEIAATTPTKKAWHHVHPHRWRWRTELSFKKPLYHTTIPRTARCHEIKPPWHDLTTAEAPPKAGSIVALFSTLIWPKRGAITVAPGWLASGEWIQWATILCVRECVSRGGLLLLQDLACNR
jgi:hypothetical protein